MEKYPEGITRDDTVHGEMYYTAADMATASAKGFRDGVASIRAPLQSALDVIERWARDAYVVCGKPSTQEGFEAAWKAEDADAYATWVAGRASLSAAEPVAYLIDWPNEPELGHYFSEEPTDAGRCLPLYAHPAPTLTQGAAIAAGAPVVKESLTTDIAAGAVEPAYLCQAWGETDFPSAAIVRGLDAVRAFLVEQWLGDAEQEHDDGTKALPAAMTDMQEEWEQEGEAWKWSIDFEIGGISVQRVDDVGASHGQAPAQPDCLTCNDRGAVGNILTAEPCPDCTPTPQAAQQAPAGASASGLQEQHDRDSRELRSLCESRDHARRERDECKAENAGLEASCATMGRLIDDLRKDGDRLEWVLRRCAGSWLRAHLGVANDTGNMDELRVLIDANRGAAPAAPSTPAAGGWISVKDQLPPCRDDQDYIGINSAGFAGIFNAIADIAGNVYCMMETAEDSVSIMSDLSIWKPFIRPLPASPTIEGESGKEVGHADQA